MSSSSPDALFNAVNGFDVSGIESALSSGASPSSLNTNGDGALHVIASKSFRTPNYLNAVSALLKAGADINLANKSGLTPVQVALQSGWQDGAALLLRKGGKYDADIAAKTNVRCPDCKRLLNTYEKDKTLASWSFENASFASA